MDSLNPQTTNSTDAMPSDAVDNSAMMVTSKRDIFLSTYQHQNFTFPNSMMHYIAKNPKNTNVYQKMVERCKYFFIKNSIFVISHLYYNRNGWGTLVNKTWKNIDINKLLCKLWITDALYVIPANVTNNSVASSIIPKIYQRDFKRLYLSDQLFSLNEFLFLCSSVKDLTLKEVTVKNGDSNVIPLAKLVEKLPNVKRINYIFTTPSNNTSKNTFKQLWKIPNLSNYNYFGLGNIPEEFDIESFYSFMKKNKKTDVVLGFSKTISEEYKTRLEIIIDEINETNNHKYKPPWINFPGLDREKFNELYDIYSS